MKTKTLNREAMLKNINGLSEGDRAYCGPYGTIRCTHEAIFANHYVGTPSTKLAARRFSVSGCTNGVLRNRGNYTMSQIRDAICA